MSSKSPGESVYVGDVAENYDRDRQGEALWSVEQKYVARFVKTLSRSSSILDIPFGTGRFADYYLDAGLEVYAVDISQDMLDIAHRKLGDRARQLTMRCADARRLFLGDKSVDYVICWRLAHLMPVEELTQVLCEFSRVTRKMIVLEVVSIRPGLLRRSMRFLKRLARALRRRFGKDKANKRGAWEHIRSFSHSEAELRRCFRVSGVTLRDVVDLAEYKGSSAKVYLLSADSASVSQG